MQKSLKDFGVVKGPRQLKPGNYEATLVHIDVIPTVHGYSFKWRFEVQLPNEVKPYTVTGLSPTPPKTGNKTCMWIKSLGGECKKDGEVKWDEFIGRVAIIRVDHEENENDSDSTVYANVIAVYPLDKLELPAQSPVEE